MISTIGDRCCGCSACSNICPKNCITMEANREGFIYPTVDEGLCSHCKRCERVCPVLNNSPEAKSCLEAWGAVSKNDKTLLGSSSGGCFSELAQSVLSNGGCVFGAAFTDNYMNVHHIMVESTEALSKLRGSKYVQSEMLDTYSRAEEQLTAGRRVLFSGTPCQIAGLKQYLGKEYNNLVCVDVICHGAPSPKLWQNYLRNIEESLGGKAEYVNFRHKEIGWSNYGMRILGDGGLTYYRPMSQDPFMKLFLRDLCLRESCYKCSFKGGLSGADITLGDYWGVETCEPSFFDRNGVSLVLIHSETGKQLFNGISDQIKKRLTDYDKAISFNRGYDSSVLRPKERNAFFRSLESLKWDKLVKKYTREKLSVRLRRYVSASVIGKMRRSLRRNRSGN